MKTEYAEQYERMCIVLDGVEDADEVIERCHRDEATFMEDGDVCLVVRFPGRPQEIYTYRALRRGLTKETSK